MFTGLIEEKGRVIRVEPGPGGLRLTISAREVSKDVSLGDSVAVNGACLTAVSINPPSITFDVVQETVDRSTLGMLKTGDSVNLERPLKAGARLGGHMVLGHVDGIGTAREIRKGAGSTVFRFDAPPEILQFVVEKGSIAVDGISLTITGHGPTWFSVAVIPHTLEHTTLGEKSVGDTVNLETDIIGKYVYKFVRGTASASDERMLGLLSEGGFLE